MPPPWSLPSAPKEFPSGRVQGRVVRSAVDMEIDPNVMPLDGPTNRTRSCGADLRSAPPPSIRRRRSRRLPASTLRARLCSDFGAGPHLEPHQEASCSLYRGPVPDLKLCRSYFAFSAQFRHSFGPVFSPLKPQLSRNNIPRILWINNLRKTPRTPFRRPTLASFWSKLYRAAGCPLSTFLF
jgi:hypothetical protein